MEELKYAITEDNKVLRTEEELENWIAKVDDFILTKKRSKCIEKQNGSLEKTDALNAQVMQKHLPDIQE